jgi:hypothetical protein
MTFVLSCYKLHKLLTGEIVYPSHGYDGYGDGDSTLLTDFVGSEMRSDWEANRDALMAFWRSGEPIARAFPGMPPWLQLRGSPSTLPWAARVFDK